MNINTNRNNIIANYVGQGWAALMAVVFLPSYIHYLGVEAYGVIGLFAITLTIVMILDLGIGATLNREMAKFTAESIEASEVHRLLNSVELISFAFALLTVPLAWFLSGYFSEHWLNAISLQSGEIRNALVLMWFVACLRLCEGVYKGALFGLGKQVWYNSLFSISATLRYAGALVILMLISPTLMAFFIWQAAVSILNVCILRRRVKLELPSIKMKYAFSANSIVDVRYFATGMIGIGLMTAIMLQLDKAVLSGMVSLQDLGYYTLAATAANTIFLGVIPITQAVYPTLVKLAETKMQDSLITLYRKITQTIIVVISTAAMLLIFFPGGVIFIWSGNTDLVNFASPLLTILAAGSFINCLSYLPFQLQIAFGKTSLMLKIYFCSILLYPALIYTLTSFYGVVGAAWSWLILNSAHFILVTLFTHRSLLKDQRLSWYIPDVLIPTLFTILSMMFAMKMKPDSYEVRTDWFIFLAITGTLSLALSIAVSPSVRTSALSLLRRK